MAGKETYEGQLNTLPESLKQKLREDLLEKPIVASETV
jgi:hypothetical protein